MSRVAVLTDSSSDLELLQAEEFGVHLLLLSIHFDGRHWLDHTDLDSQHIFNRIQNGASPPLIRLPTPEHYLGVIDNLLTRHDHVLAIHSSPLIGQVYSFALRTLEAYPQRHRVTLHNSGTTSVGMALQASRAAELLHAGRNVEQVVNVLRSVQHHQCSRLAVTTLEYLRRARLISAPSALIGEFQDRKPIFALQEGRLQSIGTVRGEEAALQHLTHTLQDQARTLPEGRLAFVTNGDPAAIDHLRSEGRRLGLSEVMSARLGAVISSFSGPNAYGFTYEPTRVWHQFKQY